MYYSIDNGKISPAKLPLCVHEGDDVREIYSPAHEEYVNAGFLPKEEIEPPTYDPTYQTISWEWKVKSGKIQKVWKVNDRLIDEVKAEKLAEINAACNLSIETGVDVETSHGVEHFALTANDQINIAFYEQLIAAGASHVPYHADGKLCRMYAAEEIAKISAAAATWKVYHTTYCNHLRDYIKGLKTAQEIAAVTYGMDLPVELQASLDAIMAALEGGGDETTD